MNEKKQPNQDQIDGNRLAEQILANSAHMVISTDLDGVVTQFNRAAEKLLGYTADEIVGKQTPAIWHDLDEIKNRADQLSQIYNQKIEPGFDVFVHAAKRGEKETQEWTFVSKQGKRFPVSLTVTALYDSKNEIVGYLGVILDLSFEKQHEWARFEDRERFRSAFEYSAIGLTVVSLDGRFLKVNPALVSILGMSEDEILATDFQSITHPEDIDSDMNNVRQLLAGEISSYSMQKRYITPKKGLIWINLTVSLVRSHDDKPLYFISQIQDITDQIQFKVRLEKMNEELKQSNQELEQFAYVASHDLQGPLRRIVSYSDILKEEMGPKLDEDNLSYLDRVVGSASKMQVLIADLLQFSRAGKTDLEWESVSIKELIDGVLNDLEAEITEKRATIEVGPMPSLVGAKTLLHQLFLNLIGNAIKFCPAGKVPHVAIESRDNGKVFEFWVKDNGIGIESKFSDRVFQVFQRLNLQSEFPGTGIGLAICKKVVERHGGKISFESEPGKGTTFYFKLSRDPVPKIQNS
ncbi:MAG: PAS domain S-box protein [Deltaproteobacteria bacterium]|nr:PAS domain S-box protein [Deltaproteobacteria bacterium]